MRHQPGDLGSAVAFTTGAAFTALMAVIDALAAAVAGTEVLAAGAAALAGWQLSRSPAPLRIHRVSWPAGSVDVGDPSIKARRVSMQDGNGRIAEVFRAAPLGGAHDLTAVPRTRLTS